MSERGIGRGATLYQSLCTICRHLREVVTPKGSRFQLCLLSLEDSRYPKYPAQPVVGCERFQQRDFDPAPPGEVE